MGDFNQIGFAMEDPMRRQAFQNFMIMPGGAAGLGMSGAGRDQSFQDYMNKRMREDAERRAVEMQEDQARQFQRQREQEMLNRRGLFGATQAGSGIQGLASPDFRSGMVPPMPFGPVGMY
jgi:50S ribosomal subunit-associated GTPase HflX